MLGVSSVLCQVPGDSSVPIEGENTPSKTFHSKTTVLYCYDCITFVPEKLILYIYIIIYIILLSVCAEPAVLVGVASRPVQLSGGRISMTCIAFGMPAPTIVWSSASQDINDYDALGDPRMNVHTFMMDDPLTGLPLSVSVLELCAATYNDSLVMDYRCTAVNALTDSSATALGENTAVFDISPMSESVYCIT